MTVSEPHQEELSLVMYIVPAGAEPPLAMPSIDPGQVEIIYEKKQKPRRKN
jgi:hypothetical protein